MAFITACCKRLLRLSLLWLACGILFVSGALAAEIEVNDPQFALGDDGYTVSADFQFELNNRLEEAVAKGVTLYFVTEFELVRPRWYWFDDKVIARSLTLRLSYHALTRQYRVSSGGLHQSFSSLSEAVRMLSRLRNWQVLDKTAEKAPKPGETFQGAIRMRLDINQLPKPFQIAAVGSKDWSLSSEWKSWQVVVPGESK